MILVEKVITINREPQIHSKPYENQHVRETMISLNALKPYKTLVKFGILDEMIVFGDHKFTPNLINPWENLLF